MNGAHHLVIYRYFYQPPLLGAGANGDAMHEAQRAGSMQLTLSIEAFKRCLVQLLVREIHAVTLKLHRAENSTNCTLTILSVWFCEAWIVKEVTSMQVISKSYRNIEEAINFDRSAHEIRGSSFQVLKHGNVVPSKYSNGLDYILRSWRIVTYILVCIHGINFIYTLGRCLT